MRTLIVFTLSVALSLSQCAPAGPSDREVEGRTLIEGFGSTLGALPIGQVGSHTAHQSSFDKGAHQAASSAGQGSFGYDHGGHASKVFGTKESSGSREKFDHSASNSYNQGTGSFSHSGAAFDHGALQLGNHFGTHFQQHQPYGNLFTASLPVAPVGHPKAPTFGNLLPPSPPAPVHPAAPVPPVLGASFAGLQQAGAAFGQSRGQGSWAFNQGHSSVNSSGNKETFSNKETFGHEAAASHAVGNGQSSQSVNSESATHDRGHQSSSTSHGGVAPIAPLIDPVVAASTIREPRIPTHQAPVAVSAPLQLEGVAPLTAPLAGSLRGERYSSGSNESGQHSSQSSNAYDHGTNDSKSFSHKESFGDASALGAGGDSGHALQAQSGSHSTQCDVSKITETTNEQKVALN